MSFETALELEEKNNDETLKTEIVEEKNVPVTVNANVTVNNTVDIDKALSEWEAYQIFTKKYTQSKQN